MEKITIYGKKYQIPAKVRGSVKNKWNRAAKLMSRFEELDQKFRGMVERGGVSDHGRLALACLLLMHTGIRVGNEASAEGYTTKPHPKSKVEPKFVQTYGLTTLLPDHLKIKSSREAQLLFVGKKYVDNVFSVRDPFIMRRLYELKKKAAVVEEFSRQENLTAKVTLFDVTDYQLTRFIKRYVGRPFSPKDFRCMRAHLYASDFIEARFSSEYPTKKALKADLKALFEHVSEKLNNLPGTVKKSYITADWSDYLLYSRLTARKPIKARKRA